MRLVEGVKDEYATLSHRWGSRDMFKLLKNNLADCKRGMPVRRLSNTFQDAIQVVSRLGIRFLWVDCLCIFQDNDDTTD